MEKIEIKKKVERVCIKNGETQRRIKRKENIHKNTNEGKTQRERRRK